MLQESSTFVINGVTFIKCGGVHNMCLLVCVYCKKPRWLCTKRPWSWLYKEFARNRTEVPIVTLYTDFLST